MAHRRLAHRGSTTLRAAIYAWVCAGLVCAGVQFPEPARVAGDPSPANSGSGPIEIVPADRLETAPRAEPDPNKADASPGPRFALRSPIVTQGAALVGRVLHLPAEPAGVGVLCVDSDGRVWARASLKTDGSFVLTVPRASEARLELRCRIGLLCRLNFRVTGTWQT